MNPLSTDRLVAALYQLRTHNDRATLARLRRGFWPGGEAETYPFVSRFFGREPDRRRENLLITLAALFALHPEPGTQTLATAMRGVQIETKSDSIEARFFALIKADGAALAHHVRHAVTLVKAKGRAIDWKDLGRAFLSWDHPDRFVQRRWGLDFWGRAWDLPQPKEPTTPPPAAPVCPVRLSDDGRLEVPLYVCRELDLKPGQELYFVRTAEGVTLVTKAEMEIFKADEAATNDATPNATPNATTEETP